jgi:hypothetical protein
MTVSTEVVGEFIAFFLATLLAPARADLSFATRFFLALPWPRSASPIFFA